MNAVRAFACRTTNGVCRTLRFGRPDRAADIVLLYESRPHAFATFKKEAFLYYLDTAHLRRMTREALRRGVLSGNMGRRKYV